jgi:hypothetical protein
VDNASLPSEAELIIQRGNVGFIVSVGSPRSGGRVYPSGFSTVDEALAYCRTLLAPPHPASAPIGEKPSPNTKD